MLDQALLVGGPDRIEVLNVLKEDGVWIRMDGRVGLDMVRVLASVRMTRASSGSRTGAGCVSTPIPSTHATGGRIHKDG